MGWSEASNLWECEWARRLLGVAGWDRVKGGPQHLASARINPRRGPWLPTHAAAARRRRRLEPPCVVAARGVRLAAAWQQSTLSPCRTVDSSPDARLLSLVSCSGGVEGSLRASRQHHTG